MKNGLWRQTALYILLSGSLSLPFQYSRVPDFALNSSNGNVARYFLFPISHFSHFLLEVVGSTIPRFLQGLPLAFAGFIIFLSEFDPLSTLAAFIFLVPFALLIYALTTVCVYSFSLRIGHFNATRALLASVGAVFSGSLVPLTLWPTPLKTAVMWQPFALVVDAPIQVVLGTRPLGPTLFAQLVCCTILWPIASWAVRTNANRCVSYGG